MLNHIIPTLIIVSIVGKIVANEDEHRECSQNVSMPLTQSVIVNIRLCLNFITMSENTKPQPPAGDDDSKHWVWGIFYYNPDDKRLLPPKRIPWLGWTVNFANVYSIAFMIVMTAVIVFVVEYIARITAT